MTMRRLIERMARGSIASAALALALASPPLASAPEPKPQAASVDAISAMLKAEELAQRFFPGSAAAAPAASKRIFRLTRDQIDASVRSLLPAVTAPPLAQVMPRDPLQTNYEFAELLTLNGANLGALTGWIGGIGAQVRANPKLAIDCERKDQLCLATRAEDLITRAFRDDVPLEKTERLITRFLARTSEAGLGEAAGELVEVVLHSPDFLFRKELATADDGHLAPQQLLQALTYTLADAPPERLGFDSRRAAQLVGAPASRRAIADQVLASKEARAKLSRFVRSWLEIKDPNEFTISLEAFPEFTPAAVTAMLAETDGFLAKHLSQPRPSLKSLTQSLPQAADPKQRLGIFSQPAVIASHSGPTSTRLVKRGVFWVRKVLCLELDQPPQGIDSDLDETLAVTERERVAQATRRKACIGCHKLIDPLGFFQENYDAIGRWRTADNGRPIDASIAVDFLEEGAIKTSTPVEALRALTDTARFKQCFLRQMFRFYMGRREEAGDDPVLREMFVDFQRDDQQDILKALQTLSLSDRALLRQ